MKIAKLFGIMISAFGASSAFAAGAGGHFSWTQFIPGVAENHMIHVATLAIVSVLLVLLGLVARVRLGSGEAAVIPEDRVTVRGFFEVILEFINNLSDTVIGHHGRKFAPMFASIFVFIFFSNLIGLIPGMTAPTDNLNTGLALGLFSFAVYNYYGIKENGIGYIKHFMANMTNGAWLLFGLLLLVLELISHLVRPFSLGLRLMANIQGDHTILGVFTDLIPIGAPIPFYLLGLFVCFMQAFIFTVLSMVYISIATAHDH
ncbi:MAG TPA: F0F1 ATP synthase subunit A [Bdellovibrionales bacterium]|nr:F0F1 ATP synthase subunit A [Bdellovibrionales bacterium]